MPANVAKKNLFGLYFASPSGIYTMSSGIGVAAAINAAAAPYRLTSRSNGFILFLVDSLIILLPLELA